MRRRYIALRYIHDLFCQQVNEKETLHITSRKKIMKCVVSCQGFFAECFLSKSAISDFDRFLPTKEMSLIAVDEKVAELFL